MMRHLFKLAWNRKRQNALILVEIFFSFLVLFVVGTLGFYLWSNLQQPLGFSYENVLAVDLDSPPSKERVDTEQLETADKVLKEAQGLEPVLAAALTNTMPYGLDSMSSQWDFEGRPIETAVDDVTVGIDKVLGLKLLEGRFFARGDEATDWLPVVINSAMARAAFGEESPIGRRFGDPSKDGSEPERRVIGVISEYRKEGELSAPGKFTFTLHRGALDGTPSKLLVKVRPGTPIEFEEQLAKRLQAVAPSWSFEVRPLLQARASSFKVRLTPLILGGIVALFLMAMVALGLIGVLWQNLLQRTREIGLRRAVGASRGAVRVQVLLEQLILTSFGVLLGVLLVVQIPLLELISFISAQVFAGGILLATILIYLLSALCALYPSLIVSRVEPAEALRYE